MLMLRNIYFLKISVFSTVQYNFMGWEIKSVKVLKIQKSILHSSKGLNKRVL